MRSAPHRAIVTAIAFCAFTGARDARALRGCEPAVAASRKSSDADPLLVRLRRRYVGRNVYGYGGLAVTCSPAWTHVYAASTPLRVEAVDRLRGVRTLLGTGVDTYPYFIGRSFEAKDPVRFVFARPRAKYVGGNSRVLGIAGACPSIVMADWQVPLLLSLVAPPRKLDADTYAIANGMSRSDVVWKRGYPHELGDARKLDAEDTWNYSDSGLQQSIVRFRKNRVIYHDDRLLM